MLPASKKDYLNIFLLITFSSILGIYIISTTVLIATDGVEYISLAKSLFAHSDHVFRKEYPGYPILIAIAHKVTGLFFKESLYTWTFTAQSASLFCRVLSLIPLYFIGKMIVGRRHTFWALFILIFLPYPAIFGSDVLRDWPHLLFLSTSLLFLILGTRTGRWCFFALAGLISALGYTIRPECAQIVVYCILWFIIILLAPKSKLGRTRAALLTFVLLISFSIPILPYMKARGKVLPTKLNKVLISYREPKESSHDSFSIGELPQTFQTELTFPLFKPILQLLEGISDNLFHYFVPMLIIGIYCFFRKLKRVLFTELFFVFALVVLYMTMLGLLSIHWGYISRRHCMPIAVFTVFFIPFGIEIVSRWISKRVLAGRRKNLVCTVLIISGVLICFFKLSRMTPLRSDKSGYLVAAKWVQDNISPNENIAVSDIRLAFYASRKGYVVGNEMPDNVKYWVYVIGQDDPKFISDGTYREKFSVGLSEREEHKKVVVYKLL